MPEFLSFFYKHLELSIAFVVVVLLILWEEFYSKRYSRSGVTPQEAVNLMNHKNALILDIRIPEAFNKGHIIHSLNIPASTLEANIKKLAKYRNSLIIIIDEKGQESLRVASQLKEKDFSNIQVLTGGLTAWNQAGLPITHISSR